MGESSHFNIYKCSIYASCRVLQRTIKKQIKGEIHLKYSFAGDYSEGAHISIIDALRETNFVQQDGYGEDIYCSKAKRNIMNHLESEDVDIHFVAGGTQANLIVIASMLKRYESIIATDQGHISVFEAGAIEANGNKICEVDSINGKLDVKMIQSVVESHTDEHMVKPGAVYITNSTETGLIYTKEELSLIYEYCKLNNLYLYIDGSRLGSALCSKENNIKISDLPNLTDVFYIGGTKNGALIGEAIVICNDDLKKNFRFHIKQHGALMAKGRILGVQFETLFKDNLYFELAEHSNKMAQLIGEGLTNLDIETEYEVLTNQVFVTLPNSVIYELDKKFKFSEWRKVDDNNTLIRLITSWATKEEEVVKFIDELKSSYKISTSV